MAMNWITRLATKAPVPVYPVFGANARDWVQDLELGGQVTLVDSPRHARLLLVAGEISPDDEDALRQIHDQVPAPMATVWIDSKPFVELSSVVVEASRDDQISTIAKKTYLDLVTGQHPGEPCLCANEPPAPWEDLGDDGHGGEGMMGGKPFGRPMAMPTEDIRDGLQLDPMDFTLGPFWPNLPPGLCAKVSLHGDVVATFEVVSKPYPVDLHDIFTQAIARPVSIAELELARARYHLRQLCRALRLSGLTALSRKVLQRLTTLEPGGSVEDLMTHLRRVGFFLSAGATTGILTSDQLNELDGPGACASETYRDARQDDPAYQQLGFTPVVPPGNDCSGRWQHWLKEANQALDLAARASEKSLNTTAGHAIASPRGKLTKAHRPTDATHVLEELLPGLEWSEAIATIASLDLAAVAESPVQSAENDHKDHKDHKAGEHKA